MPTMSLRDLITVVLYIAVFVRSQNPIFNLDCTTIPTPCNNDCYATMNAGKPTTLLWEAKGDTVSGPNRIDSGCDKNPCCNQINAPSAEENSCDEYPFASTDQGGERSILRCVIESENKQEGSLLQGFYSRKNTRAQTGCGGYPCTFEFSVDSSTVSNIDYCNGRPDNDGYQYTYTGSQYVPARRDVEAEPAEVQADYALHVPDPAHYVHPETRREFLLDNGGRILMLTRDMESSYLHREVITSYGNGSVTESVIVRELFGQEKSEPFRPAPQ